ncbi:Rha family transcriptional regulator [Shewanella sp. KCT]|uniref:Rha family transcriptional regulator n=1 Tax=Shewanella sp. KCT TaxID=2569535 RepID=UPI00164253FC|nr:Rha family transcriptional regulator [Shewanella sp. KCT]
MVTATLSTSLAMLPADAVVRDHYDIKTTSLKVAEAFGKLHKNVIQKLESLDCSDEFASANFSAHVQNVAIGNGASRESKVYQMTKDGFMFLVMGFTGKKAAAIKEAYINAFNAMAETLQQQRKSNTDDRTGLRNAINLLVSKMKLNYSEAYGLVHQRFNVRHVDELDTAQVAQAVSYVHSMAIEGEWLGKAPNLPEPEKAGYLITPEQARLMDLLLHSAAWVNYRWHQGICNGLASLNPGLYNNTFEHMNNLHYARKQLDRELTDLRLKFNCQAKRPEELQAELARARQLL